MSPIKKRILYFIESEGISKYRFYKETGITRGVLDKDSGISEDNIAKFLARYDEVSSDWLLIGKGEMLTSDNSIKKDESSSELTELRKTIKKLEFIIQSMRIALIASDSKYAKEIDDMLEDIKGW